MRLTLFALFMVLGSAQATACPEVIVPLDPKDPVIQSKAWKSALAAFKKQKYKRALGHFNKQQQRLQKSISAFFQPKKDIKVKNSKIQRWLQTYVYSRNPSVIIMDDRFTFPPLVWWAWADVACRQKDYPQAHAALTRLRQVRPGNDLRHHEALVSARLGHFEKAAKLLKNAPPDGFATPFIEGLIAAGKGQPKLARKKFLLSQGAAMIEDRRQSVAKELGQLNDG